MLLLAWLLTPGNRDSEAIWLLEWPPVANLASRTNAKQSEATKYDSKILEASLPSQGGDCLPEQLSNTVRPHFPFFKQLGRPADDFFNALGGQHIPIKYHAGILHNE